MFDSLFNIIIVLIPLAIFIGRIVSQARSKRNPTQARQRPIPVHFEDDEDEDERQFSPSAPLTVQVKKDNVNVYSSPVSAKSVTEPLPVIKAKTPSVEPSHGFIYLNHLSPMKQAVVLAEILGPPRGME